MSILTKIDSIPVFTTKRQALNWGRLNGFIGYREHTHFGKKGYIAGQTSRDIAFHKYPSQTATANMTSQNLKETISSTSYMSNAVTSYDEETLNSGSSGGSGKGATVYGGGSGAEGDTGGGK
tara:strand:- start:122 stop:487 length:366 start_codon:yes stop_codon:yes gene_type:complete